MLTINTDHIVCVRELTSEYVVTLSSTTVDLRRYTPDEPFQYEQIKNDTLHFTKGRPETEALEKWLAGQGEV